MDAGVITAIVGLLATLGAGIRFVWRRVESRFAHIERELGHARQDVEACKERHAADRSLLAEVLLVLRLLADEVASTNAASPVLAQVHRILRRAYPLHPHTPPDMIEKLGRMHAAMPMTLALLATACAHSSPDLPLPVAPPVIPALPQAARQPTPPEICSKTCSFGLTALRKDLLDTLTKPAPQGEPASGPTMR